MHVCLLIDLLTLAALIRGLRTNSASRRILCLACVVYLLAVSLHYYLLFAPWFGFFHHHRSMAAIGATYLLDFFGGFWGFFGVMVFAKGVSNIALAFALYSACSWIARISRPRQNALIPAPALPPEQGRS